MTLSEHIGRYEVRAEIGRGGMSTIYAAHDPVFNRDVAIKVLPAELLHDPSFRTRFEREAKTVASLEHPAIVPVYDFGETNGQPYLVMRLMSGGSLNDYIKKGPMSLEETARIVNHIAPALDLAHHNGIVHRDLKPANILFDQNKVPYVVDFGIAKLSESSATLTGSAIIGTPAYMSPEQARGEGDIDGRSDIYSLGVSVFEMLTGRVPYESDVVQGQLVKHIVAPIPNILDLRPDLPQDVQTIMIHVMAKRKFARYATATALAKDLNAVAEGKLLSADGTTPSGPVASNTMKETTGETSGPERRSTPPPKKTPTPQPKKTSTPPPKKNPTTPLYQTLTPAWSTSPTSPGEVEEELHPAKKRRWLPWAIITLLVVIAGVSAVLTLPIWGQKHPKRTSTAVSQLVSTATSSSELGLVIPNTITPTPSPKELPTQTPTPSASMAHTATVLPSKTNTATPTPVATVVPILLATETQSPTPTPPSVLVLGGADKIAFVKETIINQKSYADIWIANLDGTDAIQLTTDGGEKSSLQWAPDGNHVDFILGKCVESVDITTKQIQTIICPTWADDVESFQISPDGKYVALSLMSEGLYILPYDLTSLSQIKRKPLLDAATACSRYKETPTKALSWSSDSKFIAVVIVASTLGRSEDMVRVLDLNSCSGNPVRVDEFPGAHFTPTGYAANPVIQSFGWDGNVVFALNINKRDEFGELWQYNMQSNSYGQIKVFGDNRCCFRDFRWSPDGYWMAFAYEDIDHMDQVLLYYVEYNLVGKGANLQPIPFPDKFFGRGEKPQPALRPHK
jgi:serine/threonine protein kinase